MYLQTPTPGYIAAPQYINSSQVLVAGQYNVDTSAGPLSLTMPQAPPQGTAMVLVDAVNTFGTNYATLLVTGGDTIENSAANFALDMNGAAVTLLYKSTNWSIQ